MEQRGDTLETVGCVSLSTLSKKKGRQEGEDDERGGENVEMERTRLKSNKVDDNGVLSTQWDDADRLISKVR